MSAFYDDVKKMREIGRPLKQAQPVKVKPKKTTEKKTSKKAVKKNDEGTSREA